MGGKLSDKNDPEHGVAWWGLITRKSQERTKEVYDYSVHLEEDPKRAEHEATIIRCIQHGSKRGSGCVGVTITGVHS